MGGTTLLLRILLILLAVVVLGRFLGRFLRHRPVPKKRPRAHTAEDMVRCAHCGVYLPQSESVFLDGAFYCSPEHGAAGRRGA